MTCRHGPSTTSRASRLLGTASPFLGRLHLVPGDVQPRRLVGAHRPFGHECPRTPLQLLREPYRSVPRPSAEQLAVTLAKAATLGTAAAHIQCRTEGI